ncbi:glycosyltransferase [Loktanella salsilacus]|uniref:glycosyltransferase n=1 Tax=Loktanella salsilacus TaxID=195913 RepID=UPI003736AD42
MRIVHVTSLLSRRSAGVRAAVISLAREQQALGHEVHVVGLGDADYHAGDYSDFGDLPVTACDITGPEALGWSRGMAAAIKKIGPEVMHLHGLWQGIAQSVLAVHRRSGEPFIISVHGMLGAVPLTYSPGKKRIARLLFQDAAFDQAACIHATSTFEVQEIRAFGLGNSVVQLPNGVDELSLPEVAPDRAKSILSLGRIHPKKGLDVLVDAWARLEPEFPDWRLDLVGPDQNDHAAKLMTQITRLGLTRAKVSGPVYGASKDRLMAEARIFALPTRSENFALTVGESLMLGVPVVSSKGAPWEDLERESCGLWIDLGAESFAEALRRLMNLSDDERRAMGQRGRAWMQRDFTWPAVAAQLVDGYRWMRGEGSAPETLHI